MRDMVQEENAAKALADAGPEFWQAVDEMLERASGMDVDKVRQVHASLTIVAGLNPRFSEEIGTAASLLLSASMRALRPAERPGIKTLWGTV